LRHPVDRWLSHYFYAHNAASPFSISDPIDVYVEKALTAPPGGQYIYQLSGGMAENVPIDLRIKSACETLDHMSVVGWIEELELFIDRFSQRFGVELCLKRENVNTTRSTFERSVVKPQTLRRVERLCEPDLAVYEYAISRYR